MPRKAAMLSIISLFKERKIYVHFMNELNLNLYEADGIFQFSMEAFVTGNISESQSPHYIITTFRNTT